MTNSRRRSGPVALLSRALPHHPPPAPPARPDEPGRAGRVDLRDAQSGRAANGRTGGMRRVRTGKPTTRGPRGADRWRCRWGRAQVVFEQPVRVRVRREVEEGVIAKYAAQLGAASLEHGAEHGEGHGDLVAPVQLTGTGYGPQTEIRVLQVVGENVAGIADRSGLPDASSHARVQGEPDDVPAQIPKRGAKRGFYSASNTSQSSRRARFVPISAERSIIRPRMASRSPPLASSTRA
jgi:hypothetical protein